MLRMLHILFALFVFVVLAVFIASCSDTATCPCQDDAKKITHVIRDVDFVKSRYFFLDRPETGVLYPINETQIEVFRSVPDPVQPQAPAALSNIGRAFVDSLGDGSDIKEAVAKIKAGMPAPPYEQHYFARLIYGISYRFVLDSETEEVIGIELHEPVSDVRVLAVRYINANGDTTGNFGNSTDTLALELIKPRTPRPDDSFGYTWSYMMRHIYDLGAINFDLSSLEIVIQDVTMREDRTTPEGSDIPYLRIFGLDQTDATGMGPPDGQIDLSRRIIDAQKGTLTFPVLRAYDPPRDSVMEWTDGEIDLAGDFAHLPNPDLYDTIIVSPAEVSKYVMVVKFIPAQFLQYP